MKTKVTKREIQQNFSRIIEIGYCDMQFLLRYHNPNWYGCGVYGWNFDVYDLGKGLCIVTGYRPFGNLRIAYDKLHKLEGKASAIVYDRSIPSEKSQKKVERLLQKAIALAE